MENNSKVLFQKGILIGPPGSAPTVEIDAQGNARFDGGVSIAGNISNLTGSAITINANGQDVDFRIGSQLNIYNFVSDAGAFSGKGAIAFGTTPPTSGFVTIDPPALTSVASTPFYREQIINTNAVTVPAGTASIVASFGVAEPNITATGTVTRAATVYIADAPTEGGTSNDALLVASGSTRMLSGAANWCQGQDVTSASTITLGTDGNLFNILSNTTINLMTTTGYQRGTSIWLRFNATMSVAHGQTAGATTAGFFFASAGSYNVRSGYMAQFVLCSTGSVINPDGTSTSVWNHVTAFGVT